MFANLDIVQVILIGIGLVIVASIFLKSDGEKKPTPVPPPVVPSPVVPTVPHDKHDSHDFMCLVQKWYELKACSHEQGLHDVCEVLDSQVFPLLNKGENQPNNEVKPS